MLKDVRNTEKSSCIKNTQSEIEELDLDRKRKASEGDFVIYIHTVVSDSNHNETAASGKMPT